MSYARRGPRPARACGADVLRTHSEIKILKKVRHPNVIQLYEIIETEKELYMIMEYCNGGELFDYIVRHTRLSEK